MLVPVENELDTVGGQERSYLTKVGQPLVGLDFFILRDWKQVVV
jgi:hypothetical protein